MRKQGRPRFGEVVVCKITKIFPNSAFAELVEYRMSGMIHVSEVALKWVRDIREFLKTNQHVVCKVMRVEGSNISLSIKRVRKVEQDAKLNEFKRENKAEKLLEMAAKKMKKDLETAYKEVGFSLQEEFGSLNKALEIAVKNPDLFRQKGIKKEWIDPLKDIALKSFSEKTYEVKAELILSCYASNGVEIIKKTLIDATEGKSVEVKYISSPKYMLISRGKDIKKIKQEVEQTAEEITKNIQKSNGLCRFHMIEA
jgi:translation initiation factor 2 subunit 1